MRHVVLALVLLAAMPSALQAAAPVVCEGGRCYPVAPSLRPVYAPRAAAVPLVSLRAGSGCDRGPRRAPVRNLLNNVRDRMEARRNR